MSVVSSSFPRVVVGTSMRRLFMLSRRRIKNFLSISNLTDDVLTLFDIQLFSSPYLALITLLHKVCGS